eukprot:2749538-Amphidinium_carterae.1
MWLVWGPQRYPQGAERPSGRQWRAPWVDPLGVRHDTAPILLASCCLHLNSSGMETPARSHRWAEAAPTETP